MFPVGWLVPHPEARPRVTRRCRIALIEPQRACMAEMDLLDNWCGRTTGSKEKLETVRRRLQYRW